MRNVIELTSPMRGAVSNHGRNHGDDIIASSPWVQGNHEQPHRIVLRDTASDWIVHTQVIDPENNTAFFVWGAYHHKSGTDLSAVFARAWARFESRARSHMGLPLRDVDDAWENV